MKARIFSLVILFVLAISIKSAYAANTYTWQGGTSGSWNVAANWSFNGSTSTVYPGSSGTTDIAVINTSNAIITYTGTLTIGQLESTAYGVSGIVINFTGTTPTLTITAGLSIAQPSAAAVCITFSGSGTASISGTSSFQYQASMLISSSATVTFATGSTIDFTVNQGTLTNNGTLNLTGCNFNIGSNSSFVSPGTTIANSTVFNINNTPGYITYAGKFVANSCTFNFPSKAYLKSTSSSSAFTATKSTFNLTGSGGAAYIYNNGTFRDHGSTYSLTGQSTCIQNIASSSMHMSGTTVTFGGGNNNQFINNAGTFTADSASSINVSTFTSYITNSGTFYAGTSGSSCIITLGAQSANLTNTGAFYLGSTSIIYPTAVSTSVTNTSPGVFTLQSDASGSAAIGPLNTSIGSSQQALCTGTFNVERFFQGSTTYDNVKGRWIARAYRIISSPVNTGTLVNGNYIYDLSYIVGTTAGKTTLANSLTNSFITGCTGGSTSAGNPSTYLFNEFYTPSNVTFTSGNFVGITNITIPSSIGTIAGAGYTIPVGNGVLFFYRGAATNWTARTQSPFIAPESVTLTSIGILNQQSVTVKEWFNPTSSNIAFTGSGKNGNHAVRGLCMVGNPYACTIDWETVNTGGITVTNISPTIYTFNPITEQFDTYSSNSHLGSTATFSGKIASGEGFFVQADTTGAAMTFTENAKAATYLPLGTSLYMGTPVAQSVPQVLRLKLIIDSLNYDNTVVTFNSTASTQYNKVEDSQYLTGLNAMESLSSFSDDNIPLSINSLPLPKQTQQVIRLNVTGKVNGQYMLQRTALDAIPQIYEVWLMDKYKKDSLDLRNNTTYIFNINLSDTASFGSNRFQIVIRQNKAVALHLLNFTALKTTNGSQINWTTENEQNYTNFTVERSTDNGMTFNVIGGFVSSAQGTYSLLDKNPVNGTDQYRLKIEDLNNNISYSNVITLTYGNPGAIVNNISVYPNPSNGVINLLIIANGGSSVSSNLSSLQIANAIPGFASGNTSGSSSYDIKIISITGSVIKTATSTSTTWQDNVSGLAPGTYIIEVTNKSNNSLIGKSTFVKI